MNNDVVRLNLGAKSANNVSSNAIKASALLKTQENDDAKSMKDSMEFLKSMGCAQVNMDNLSSFSSGR